MGIDAGELFPEPLTDEVVAGAGVVVTMGCGDSCPVLQGVATWTGTSLILQGLTELQRMPEMVPAFFGAGAQHEQGGHPCQCGQEEECVGVGVEEVGERGTGEGCDR